MINDWTLKGKENSPEETIARIKRILEQNGFSTKYMLTANAVDGCYSSYVCLAGEGLSDIGSNGKGTTEEYCMASAYAEFMERMQNICFMPFIIDEVKNEYEKVLEYAEGIIDINKDNEWNPCIRMLFNQIAKSANMMPCFDTIVADTIKELAVDIFGSSKLPALGFWSCRENKIVMLPQPLISIVGSNGMASGNTIEEAIVQAGCEIFERYATYAMLKDEVVFPEFPEDVIEKYPYIKHVKDEINSRGDYEIRFYDASLGKGLPVACGIIINKTTGRLAFKLGSHTSLAVALERVFTEIFQGRDLDAATSTCAVSFADRSINAADYDFNMIKAGCSPITADFFIRNPSYEYKEWAWDENDALDNSLMSSRIISMLDDMSGEGEGRGVYILDNSILGFPTVFLYVPGISEVVALDIDFIKDMNALAQVHQLLCGDEDVTDHKDLDKIRLNALKIRYRMLENTYSALAGVPFKEGYPQVSREMELLAAICLYAKGEYKKASSEINKVTEYERRIKKDKMVTWLPAVDTYVGAIAKGYDHETAGKLIKTLYSAETADKVIYQFAQPEQALKRIYPHCNNGNCRKCKYRVNCNHEMLANLQFYLMKKRKEYIGKRFYDQKKEVAV